MHFNPSFSRPAFSVSPHEFQSRRIISVYVGYGTTKLKECSKSPPGVLLYASVVLLNDKIDLWSGFCGNSRSKVS